MSYVRAVNGCHDQRVHDWNIVCGGSGEEGKEKGEESGEYVEY